MSLINEALKKAQRQRTDVAAAGDDPAAEGRPVQKRAAPMGAQTMILVAAAAVALVVCSVVLTVYLLTRNPAEPAKAVAATPAPKPPAVDLNAPSPVIVAPVIAKPAAPTPAEPVSASGVAVTPTSQPATPAAKPAATPTAPVATPLPAAPVPAPAASPAAVTSASAPAPAAGTAATLPPDPRVLQFVDAIKVTGIRSSGTESKVLMNDRVFRVNEIVERTLGVRLVKVASDALTFEDANGVVYTKTF